MTGEHKAPEAQTETQSNQEWSRRPRAQEFAVCMGFEAMRICLGIEPETYTYAEVVRWMEQMHQARSGDKS